jgi:four helix bundle protein
MDGPQRFEDLIAWQKARVLAREVYEATRKAPFRYDRPLVDQVRRSSISVASNVAEGFERQNSLAEFSHFLTIAKGSCAELRAQLYLALDVGHLPDEDFRRLFDLAEETSRVTAGLKSSVERRRAK